MPIRQLAATIFFTLYVGSTLVGLMPPAYAGQSVDHRIYAELLEKYVDAGRVNYKRLKTDEKQLDAYLKVLEAVDPAALSRDEQFAFYINAYNAWTLKLILSGYPGVKSIKDLGTLFKSPWKKKIVRIDGGITTLDDVEHNILRPRFQDPRVHFAINCAAKSCPPLRSEPYRGEVLNQQLDDVTRSFLNNASSYRLQGEQFYVSRIFKWFSEDFSNDVIGFYLVYATADLKKQLRLGMNQIRVAYLPYDWSLNGN
jgi:hypothetical protein